MSTFIPVDFDEVQEPKPVSNGRYRLQITECAITKTGDKAKNPGRDQYKVSLAILGEEDAPNVTHYVSLPCAEDEAKTAKFKALLLKRFLVLFGVKFAKDGIDIEETSMEMLGAEADVELTLSEPDDQGNVYNRLVIPRLQDEEGYRR
jgi:hypothetical protein